MVNSHVLVAECHCPDIPCPHTFPRPRSIADCIASYGRSVHACERTLRARAARSTIGRPCARIMHICHVTIQICGPKRSTCIKVSARYKDGLILFTFSGPDLQVHENYQRFLSPLLETVHLLYLHIQRTQIHDEFLTRVEPSCS